MLKQTIMISVVVALLSVTGSAKGNNGMHGQHNQATTMVELSDTQKEALSFMIEEEKVARDVYAYLYDIWGTRIFTNITQAEQKHMDAILILINQYGLNAPSTLESRGSFENSELQALYDTLIEKGSNSLVDALEVGVMVEETDIADLKELLDAGVPSTIQKVYQNLLKGSYNHLNAFNRQLSRQ